MMMMGMKECLRWKYDQIPYKYACEYHKASIMTGTNKKNEVYKIMFKF